MLSKSKLDYAQKLYLNGDFAQAAEGYAALLKHDSKNPYLLINTANAYYKAGEHGKALANYYQAKRYIPRDHELNNNLQLLLDEVKLKQPAMLGYGYMTLMEAFLLLLLTNILFVFRKKFLHKTALRYLMIVIFVFSLLNFLFIANNQVMKRHAVIISAAQLRSGNSEEFPELMELLPAQIVEVIGTDNHWSELVIDEQRGWLSDSALDLI